MVKPSSSAVRSAVRALGDRRAEPDPDWVSGLTGQPVALVQRLLNEVGQLKGTEAQIHQTLLEGGRSNYAQFRAPFELYALVRLLRPAHVVETGVSAGISSAHVLMALERNGHGTLHSIDLPLLQKGPRLRTRDSPVSIPPGRSSGWAVPPSIASGWDLRIGESQTQLPALIDELSSVGLFLHDSLHTPKHLTFELETVRPKLTTGSVVLADNTKWTGRSFERFAAELGVPVIRRKRVSDLVGTRIPVRPGLPDPRDQ
jgi:hypothetical protein